MTERTKVMSKIKKLNILFRYAYKYSIGSKKKKKGKKSKGKAKVNLGKCLPLLRGHKDTW